MTAFTVSNIIAAARLVSSDCLVWLQKPANPNLAQVRWLPPYYPAPCLSFEGARLGMDAAISAFVTAALQ